MMDDSATQKQINYIKALCNDIGLEATDEYDLDELSKSKASEIIQELIPLASEGSPEDGWNDWTYADTKDHG